jgi:ATPase family AAA domain-containing protein 2
LPLAKEQPKVQPELTKEQLKAQYKADRSTVNMLRLALMGLMTSIRNQYRGFKMSAIPDRDIEYLYQEQAGIASNLTEEQRAQQEYVRPYEIATDKHGNRGLRQTATGKFFYNCNTQIIEQRLSNGYYKRTKEFLWDLKTLAKDAKQIGNPDNLMKANNMYGLAMAEVDVLETHNPQLIAQCEAVYLREQKRVELEKEKAARIGATTNGLNFHPPAPESTVPSGPVQLGERMDTRPDQPIGPLPQNDPNLNTSVQSNGIGGPSHQNGSIVTQEFASQVISSGTRPQFPGGYTLTPSNPTTQEVQSQFGQADQGKESSTTSGNITSNRSSGGELYKLAQPLPEGTQPSLLHSGHPDWLSLAPVMNSDSSQLPDTYPNSENTNNSNRNTMSNPDALYRVNSNGISGLSQDTSPKQQYYGTAEAEADAFHKPKLSAREMQHQPGQGGYVTARDTSLPQSTYPPPSGIPADGQRTTAAGPSHPHRSDILDLVNPPTPTPKPHPPFRLSETSLKSLHNRLARLTDGLSIEQLEMVDARCMDVVWRRRGMWDRRQMVEEIDEALEEVLQDVSWQAGLTAQLEDLE